MENNESLKNMIEAHKKDIETIENYFNLNKFPTGFTPTELKIIQRWLMVIIKNEESWLKVK